MVRTVPSVCACDANTGSRYRMLWPAADPSPVLVLFSLATNPLLPVPCCQSPAIRVELPELTELVDRLTDGAGCAMLRSGAGGEEAAPADVEMKESE
eukprot:307583-Pyramimonas_sp.AAC.1